MKKISLWAKNHQWPARVIIVASFCLLIISAIATGMLLNNIILPSSLLSLLIIIYFTALVLYPFKSEKKNFTGSQFYRRQKKCDLLLVSSTFCIIICISHDQFRKINYFSPLRAATSSTAVLPPVDSSVKVYKTIPAFSASLLDENGNSLKWKEKKKLLKAQVRAIKKSDMSKGAKIALIVLSVLVALGLIALIAALSCEISCSGSAAGAVLVGVGGTALVVFLLIVAIRAITGKRKKKAIIQEEPAKTG